MCMTFEEIKKVADDVEKYADILNCPTPENNIVIQDGVVKLIVNKKSVMERKLSTREMNLQNVEYKYNVFYSKEELCYSPLEADRASNKPYWVQNYFKINFPTFIAIPLMSWLMVGKIPDIIDFCKIYLLAYTEVVPKNELLSRRHLFTGDFDQYKNIGQQIRYTDGRIITNHVIRFKHKFLKYVKGLPCNEFTTKAMCCRIYKIYGSCIRDPYNMIRAYELGAKTDYNLWMDICLGIDGVIDGVPYYGYSCTEASKEFRQTKVEFRHKDLNKDVGIALAKNNEKSGGVYLIKDELFKEIISKIQNQQIHGIVKFEC